MTYRAYSNDELRRMASGETTRAQVDNERRVRNLGGVGGEVGSFLSAAGDSLSFGFGDELMGVGAGALAALNGQDFGSAYGEQTERSRQRLRDAWQYHSGAALLGGLAGAAVPGFGLANAARGASLLRNLTPLQRIMAAASGGALAGGVAGFGGSEAPLNTAEGLGYRALDAAGGAAGGAIAGGALQGVGMGASHAFRNMVRPAFQPEQRAAMELGRAMNRAGIHNASDFASRAGELVQGEALTPGSNPLVMDALGDAGTNLTMIAGARQSAGRNAMRETLEGRNLGARERINGMLWRELGDGSRRGVVETLEDLEAVQRNEAAPLYAQVYERSVGAIPDDLRDFVRFNDRAGSNFNAALQTTRESMRRLTGRVDLSDDAMMARPEFWHRLLENSQAEVGAVMRSARMNPLGGPRGSAVADMTSDANALNAKVRRLLGPVFREAQDKYSGAAKAMDAIDFGRAAATSTDDVELGRITRRLRRMSRGEREMAKFAAITRLSNELARADTGTGRADVVRRIMGNEAKRNALQVLFNGEGNLQRVIQALEHERRLFMNYADTNLGRNSPTADKMQGAQQLFGDGSGGGILNSLRRWAGADVGERYNEELANSILDLMQRPLTGANAIGDPLSFANQQGLLRRALAEAEAQRTLRSRAGPEAFIGGFAGALGAPPVG